MQSVTQDSIFRDVIPHGMINGYRRIEGPYCLHLQGKKFNNPHGITSRKTWNFIT